MQLASTVHGQVCGVCRQGNDGRSFAPGTAKAFAYYDTTGKNLTSDPALDVTLSTGLGGPAINDYRSHSGVGPIWRIGAWKADSYNGSPNVTQSSQGLAVYGPAGSQTVMSSLQGSIATVKGNGFAVNQRITGVNGGFPFTAVSLQANVAGNLADGLLLKDDTNTERFKLDRSTGKPHFNNQVVGATALVAGTATVTGVPISTTTVAFLSRFTLGGTAGNLYSGTYVQGANGSFTITSSSSSDTSIVLWFLVDKL
jgi:hypothetical protein